MKKVFLLLLGCSMIAACQTVKVEGDITSFASSSNGVSIGVHAHTSGTIKNSTLDSLTKGYPVWIAGQKLQISHTDTSADINATFNLYYK